MSLFQSAKAVVRESLEQWRLPDVAKQEDRRDRAGLPSKDPGIDATVSEAIDWLLRAQSESASADGGAARHFSFIDGWAPSYPETSGYIVSTLIDYAHRSGREDVMQSARVMTDWLVSIQFEDGGFQGGMIDAEPCVPVTFNTGQILLGLASAAREWGEPYTASMNKAASWLVASQDSDGCWRKFPTPFAAQGEKVYETHVAWGLLEAARVAESQEYGDAAMANMRWAMTHQHENGWMANCCLSDPAQPLTHTLGYCLRGLVEGYLYRKDDDVFEAALRLARGLQSAVDDDGYLPGCLDSEWRGRVDSVCLTGSVQIAHSMLILSSEADDPTLRDTGYKLNRFVRRTMHLEGDPGIRGGIKGSFPVSGPYGTYQLLNWAPKFFIDSNLLEQDMRNATEGRSSSAAGR
ncbi:MAG: hypothetical protein AAFX10_02930 [Pseudomonadota bacterium]